MTTFTKYVKQAAFTAVVMFAALTGTVEANDNYGRNPAVQNWTMDIRGAVNRAYGHVQINGVDLISDNMRNGGSIRFGVWVETRGNVLPTYVVVVCDPEQCNA
jgi:hypothetical protein